MKKLNKLASLCAILAIAFVCAPKVSAQVNDDSDMIGDFIQYDANGNLIYGYNPYAVTVVPAYDQIIEFVCHWGFFLPFLD